MAEKIHILNKKFKAPFPGDVKPMLATLTDKPFNSSQWIFEIKWDGYRVIAKKRGKQISLTSRNLTSFDEKFYTIKKELGKIKNSCVLDGEVVAVDENNKPRFQLLQNYSKTGEGNIVFYIFDILWLDGYSLEEIPLIERKEILSDILPKMNNIFYCDHILEKGKELFREVKKSGLEGIIAKKSDSAYYENSRSQSWLKIKTIMAMEAVICGYTEPEGSRKYFGALILGVYNKGKLTYIGHTGTGFNSKNQEPVYSLLKKYVTNDSPFEKPPKPNAPVTWILPKLVCEVKFSHMTNDGVLRHPVFMRIRDDKKPAEITLSAQKKKKLSYS